MQIRNPQIDEESGSRAVVESLESRVLMSTVMGAVYNDLNANGHRDIGEPGLAGWVVNLRNGFNFSTILKSTISDAAGNYSLSYGTRELAPQVFITAGVQSGWQRTEPNAGYYLIRAGFFGTIANLNFGNHYVGALSAPAAAAPNPATTLQTASASSIDSSRSLFSTEPITDSPLGAG